MNPRHLIANREYSSALDVFLRREADVYFAVDVVAVGDDDDE